MTGPGKARQRPRAERVRNEFSADVREIAAAMARLGADGPALISRAAIAVEDGFGSGRSADDPGRRSSNDIRDLADVVARRIHIETNEIDIDPVATAVAEMLAHLHAAVLSVRRAANAFEAAQRIPAAENDDSTAAPECVNCSRWDVHSPVHKAGRCRACYEYRRRNDRDAPERLVTSRPEVAGRRRVVRAA